MKRNVIFLAKIAVVALVAVGLLIPLNLLYKSGLTYAGANEGIEKYENVPDGIQYANFGPSYGMSCFDYEELTAQGKTCFNFALTMQDLYHDYSIYKQYEDKLEKGAVVAVTVSYFSFCSDNGSPSSARYYKILNKAAIKNYTPENDISANYFPIYGKGSSLIRDLTSDMLNAIMAKGLTENDDSAADVAVANEAEQGRVETLQADSKVRVMTVESGNLRAFDNYIDENVNILIEWVERMQKNGHKPILVLTPYWIDYANGFDAELLDRCYHTPIAQVVEKTGVPYENFNSETYTEFITNTEYFSNCDHVRQEGGKAFMKLFLQCIGK